MARRRCLAEARFAKQSRASESDQAAAFQAKHPALRPHRDLVAELGEPVGES